MNAVTILNTPFVQVALPIIVTFIMAAWLNSKRLDDFRGNFDRRFEQVDKQFEQIDRRFEQMLGDGNQRIVRVKSGPRPSADNAH